MGSKLSYNLPIDRLPSMRWAQLIMVCGTGERSKEKERYGREERRIRMEEDTVGTLQ